MPECYTNLILDLDGVLWRGNTPIRENLEPLARLAREGARLVFLTNNSTRSRRRLALKISRLLGHNVSEDDVITSGYSASVWLRERYGCLRVLPVGGVGLVEELSNACHTPLEPIEWRDAQAVVVGLDRSLTYSKLAAAHRAVTSGALLIATNSDPSFPVEDGTEPGAGAVVRFLEESTGRRRDFDAGKPGRWILELALRRIPQGEPALVVGDRLDTDARMAAENGLSALILLTGVTRRPPEERPPGTWFARDLGKAYKPGRGVCPGHG